MKALQSCSLTAEKIVVHWNTCMALMWRVSKMDNHCDGYGMKRFWEILEIWICLPMPDPNDIWGLVSPCLGIVQLARLGYNNSCWGFSRWWVLIWCSFWAGTYPSLVSLPYFGHYHEKFAVKFHSLLLSLHVVLNDASTAKLLASSYGWYYMYINNK